MLFERKTSKSAFQLGYVGEDFEDAQLRREEGRGYPRLTAITNRKTNEITARELERALDGHFGEDSRNFARQIKNRRIFLVDVCKKDCRRRHPDCDAKGLGGFYGTDKNGGLPYFNRKIGNNKPNMCNNAKDETNHFCPTTNLNSYTLENKLPDPKKYHLTDSFTVEIKKTPGEIPVAKILSHISRLDRAPANLNHEQRGRALNKFLGYAEGSVNRDELYFRRERGFEKPQKVYLTDDKEFKLVMRPFNPKAKECRFFVGKSNDISVNHYTTQSVYTERLVYSRSGYNPLYLQRDEGILIWIPGKNHISDELTNIISTVNAESHGIVQLINEKDVFRYNYCGYFVFFEKSVDMKNYSNKLFQKLEHLEVTHRRARPSITEKPNWMTITWHPNNTPPLYTGKDSWDLPRPDLLSKDGELNLILSVNRKQSMLEDGIDLSIKGDGVEQKVSLNLDTHGRVFVTLKFPEVGNYVLLVECGSDFRVIRLYVSDTNNGSMVSVTYSDVKNGFLPLPAFGQRLTPVDANIPEQSTKSEIINHQLTTYFKHYNLNLSDFDDYSREHVLREITRITFHERLNEWMKRRNKLFNLILDNYKNSDSRKDERRIGEYIKEDLVSYKISKRSDKDDTITWEPKPPCVQKIHGIDTHFILHDAKPNREITVNYRSLIIDKKSGIRFISSEEAVELQLPVHHLRPDIDEMTYSSAQDWLSTVWNAGQHTAKPLVETGDDWFTIRWNGDMIFSRPTEVVNKIAPHQWRKWWDHSLLNEKWLPNHKFGNALYFQQNNKLMFLQLTIDKEKHDEDYPHEVILGMLEFSDQIIQTGITISTHSSELDKQRVTWLDSVGISNGPDESKIFLPWTKYPRDNKAGDSAYLVRETFRAFCSMNKTLDIDDDKLGNKGLPRTLFRKGFFKTANPLGFYQNGQLRLYDVCKELGIIDAETDTEQLSSLARRALLRRMWWKYED